MSNRLLLSFLLLAASLALVAATAAPNHPGRVLVNPADANWEPSVHGSESATLREDKESGGVELFARYPGGHVFPPHWHSANERVVLIEGRLSIEDGAQKRYIEPGGYAYLPAHQIQKMTCASETRCSFYVFWDGALDFNPAE